MSVNLMASSDLSKVDELARLNVRRLSAGTAIAQVAYKHVAPFAESFLENGDCAVFSENVRQYSELQNLSRAENKDYARRARHART